MLLRFHCLSTFSILCLLYLYVKTYIYILCFFSFLILLFPFAVSDVMIGMVATTMFVNETDESVDVCAEIVQLPGELQTDLTVALSTTNGSKAGLL